MEHFGFHSRASRCASAIWTGVILAAFRWLVTGLSPLRALLSARRKSSLSSSEGAQPLLRPLHLVVPPDRPADALVRAMGRHRTAGGSSCSSRTPLIHPAPFRAPRILLVVIGRRSASASASPSQPPSFLQDRGVRRDFHDLVGCVQHLPVPLPGGVARKGPATRDLIDRIAERFAKYLSHSQ